MSLVNTPARKGINTRLSGDAERLLEDAERSSGDTSDERRDSSACGDGGVKANARRVYTATVTARAA